MKIKIIERGCDMTIKFTGQIGTTSCCGQSRWALITARTTKKHFIQALLIAITEFKKSEE